MCKFFQIISAVALAFCLLIFSLVAIGQYKIPNEITTIENTENELNNIFKIPLYNLNFENENQASVGAPRNNISQAEIKLLNIIPVKSAQIINTQRKYVTLGGELFGVKLYTDGVLVVDTDTVDTENGVLSPASEAGLKIGDLIKSVNNEKISSTKELIQKIQASKGNKMSFSVLRNNKVLNIEFCTFKEKYSGKYKAGLWVRDSSAGLGTVTFYDNENGTFGGLGHGIYDIDTNELMPINRGEVYSAYVNGIYKSSSGNVGELCGVITGEALGDLYINNDLGVYGFIKSKKSNSVPVAVRQEVKEGKASIFCTLDDDGVKEYEIEIKKIFTNSDSVNKNMVIEVTDKALLEKTGGIVQGMSGSPVIQNGKLVGAVTHVFVDNPTKGYGIFAENMLETARSLEVSQEQKNAG